MEHHVMKAIKPKVNEVKEPQNKSTLRTALTNLRRLTARSDHPSAGPTTGSTGAVRADDLSVTGKLTFRPQVNAVSFWGVFRGSRQVQVEATVALKAQHHGFSRCQAVASTGALEVATLVAA